MIFDRTYVVIFYGWHSRNVCVWYAPQIKIIFIRFGLVRLEKKNFYNEIGYHKNEYLGMIVLCIFKCECLIFSRFINFKCIAGTLPINVFTHILLIKHKSCLRFFLSVGCLHSIIYSGEKTMHILRFQFFLFTSTEIYWHNWWLAE